MRLPIMNNSGNAVDKTELNLPENPLDLTFAINFLQLLPDEGEALLNQIYNLYLEETTNRLEEMSRLLEIRDTEGLRLLAHSIRGGSANVGARGMETLSKHMEKLAGSTDLSPLLGQLNLEFERVKSVIVQGVSQLEMN